MSSSGGGGGWEPLFSAVEQKKEAGCVWLAGWRGTGGGESG